MIGIRQRAETRADQPGGSPSGPVLLAPLRAEVAAVRLGAPGLRVERVGMGPARAEAARARLARSLPPGAPLAVVGFAAGLSATDRPGDVVVADELVTLDGSRPPAVLDGELAEQLRRALAPRLGGRVRTGRIACARKIVSAGATAASGAAAGALACEMESAWLAPLAERGRFAVARVLVDKPGRGIVSPFTIIGGAVAWRRLTTVAAVLADELPRAARPEL